MLLGPYSAGLPSGWSEFADQSSHGSSWFACLHLLTRVCSCSYMSVCIGTHMCMCPHVSAGSHGREHSGAHMHLCVSTCVPACTCVYRHMCRCMCSCVCTWALTHAHACSPACVHMPHVNRTHVCTCVCVCVCGISASSPPSLREPAGLTVRPPSVPPAGLVQFPTRSTSALGTCCGERRGSGRPWAPGVGRCCQGRQRLRGRHGGGEVPAFPLPVFPPSSPRVDESRVWMNHYNFSSVRGMPSRRTCLTLSSYNSEPHKSSLILHKQPSYILFQIQIKSQKYFSGNVNWYSGYGTQHGGSLKN